MSPAQQAAALPLVPPKFSASFSDKLTGGASSVRRSDGAESGAAGEEVPASSGANVASSVISEIVRTILVLYPRPILGSARSSTTKDSLRVKGVLSPSWV